MPLITPVQGAQHSLMVANLTSNSSSLVPVGFEPVVDLMLNYGEVQVSMGNQFPTTECTNPPNITFFSEDLVKSSTSYTLILVDPDAPFPQSPLYADWCHWILPGLLPKSYNEILSNLTTRTNSTSEGSLSSSDHEVVQTRSPIVPYYPPSPDIRSDPHRYIFLLYREPSLGLESYPSLRAENLGIVIDDPSTRKNFNTTHFAEVYQLTLVGFNWFKGVNKIHDANTLKTTP